MVEINYFRKKFHYAEDASAVIQSFDIHKVISLHSKSSESPHFRKLFLIMSVPFLFHVFAFHMPVSTPLSDSGSWPTCNPIGCLQNAV